MFPNKSTPIAAVLATLCLLGTAPAQAGKTLDAIKARGQIICGVSTGLTGFSATDSAGRWSGLDVDVCKALAAATLKDAEKVKYVPLNSQQRFTALQSGEVDILARNTTFTLTRDASLGLHSTVTNYYDGQGFMVPVKSKIKSAKQLKGQTVCVQSGTTSEKNLASFSKANGLSLKPVVFEKFDAANAAYFSGRCIAYTTDASGLAAIRTKEAKDPKDHLILPELISKEPLGPVVRRGDDEWFAIVKWVMYGTMEAEEYGVTQANVDQLKTSSADPAVQRLLGGGNEDMGKLLGLDKDWLARAIKVTGNYGESFERNLGQKSSLNLPRGLNNQWNKGGLIYAYPARSIRDKVFEPFFSTKDVGKGTGLGLSMVYGFVKQSGGHIKLYSEVGHGSTFRIYLPRADSVQSEKHGETTPRVPIEGSNETILVVEDDALVRTYVTTQLQSLGYKTIPAANASEALEIVDSGAKFDLLFTDVIMPGAMNGRQLADAVAKRRAPLRVLFTSGYTEDAVVHHGRLDPGVLLLAKPYRKTELARMVRLALDTALAPRSPPLVLGSGPSDADARFSRPPPSPE